MRNPLLWVGILGAALLLYLALKKGSVVEMAGAKKLSKKAIENAYDKIFKMKAHGVQFNIMDLSKVRKDVSAAIVAGEDAASAMDAAIKKYRVN
jgi:hypothetical protein